MERVGRLPRAHEAVWQGSVGVYFFGAARAANGRFAERVGKRRAFSLHLGQGFELRDELSGGLGEEGGGKRPLRLLDGELFVMHFL